MNKEKIESGQKLFPQEEVELVRSGNLELFDRYLENYSLCKEAEFELLKPENEACFKHYISGNVAHYRLEEEVEIKLLQSGKGELIALYICEGHKFSPAAQEMLIKQGKAALVAMYFHRFFLGKKLERELIKRGDAELFEKYMQRLGNNLYMDNVTELVKIANAKIVECYINRRPLPDNAERELVLRGNERLLQVYEAKWWKLSLFGKKKGGQ